MFDKVQCWELVFIFVSFSVDFNLFEKWYHGLICHRCVFTCWRMWVFTAPLYASVKLSLAQNGCDWVMTCMLSWFVSVPVVLSAEYSHWQIQSNSMYIASNHNKALASRLKIWSALKQVPRDPTIIQGKPQQSFYPPWARTWWQWEGKTHF